MSFQWIVDIAENLSINRKKMVASTRARDGSVRVVSRGTQPKIFTVTLPDGVPWTQLRTDIIAAEALDRIATAVIVIPFAKFPFYYGDVAPASNETYTVRCIDFPDWIIFARNQVSWSGPFVFVEVI